METSEKKGCFSSFFFKYLSKTVLFAEVSLYQLQEFSTFTRNFLKIEGWALYFSDFLPFYLLNFATKKEPKLDWCSVIRWLLRCLHLSSQLMTGHHSELGSVCIEFGNMQNTNLNFVHSNNWKYILFFNTTISLSKMFSPAFSASVTRSMTSNPNLISNFTCTSLEICRVCNDYSISSKDWTPRKILIFI